jgi:hypothetical protein
VPGAIPEPTTELWLWLRTYLDENIWPSTDEAVVLQLANDWGSAAQAMSDMIAAASAANNELPGVWPDSAGTIYQRNAARTLDDYRTMVQVYRDMEKLCRDFAGQISALRNSIIAELVVNAALFAALALFPGAGLLMGRFASQLALRLMGFSRAAVAAMEAPAAMVPHALKFAGELLAEGAEEIGVDFLGQSMSIAGGYQNGYNVKQMLISGGAGVLGAGLAPVLMPVGRAVSFPAGRLTNRLGAPPGLTRSVEQMSSAFVVNGITSPVAGTTVQSLADGRLPTLSDYGHAIVNQAPLAGALASSRIAALNGGVATGNFLRGDRFTLPNLPAGGHPPVPAGVGGGPEFAAGGGPGGTAGAGPGGTAGSGPGGGAGAGPGGAGGAGSGGGAGAGSGGASGSGSGSAHAQSSGGQSAGGSNQSGTDHHQAGSGEQSGDQQSGEQHGADQADGGLGQPSASEGPGQSAGTVAAESGPQAPAGATGAAPGTAGGGAPVQGHGSSVQGQAPGSAQASVTGHTNSSSQGPAGPQNAGGAQSSSGSQSGGSQNSGSQQGAGRANRVDSDEKTVDEDLSDTSAQDTVADQAADSPPSTDPNAGEGSTDQVEGSQAPDGVGGQAVQGGPEGPVDPPDQAGNEPQSTAGGNPWFDSSVPFGPAATDPAGDLMASELQSYGRNGARWAVGEDGRVRRVTARLREDHTDGNRGDAGRRQRRTVTRAHGIPGDSGGHFLARRFFQNDDLYNLFAQNEQFNNVAYGNLEKEWAAWIAEGYEVEVEIVPGPGKARPESITVSYTVLDTRSGQEQVVWVSGRTFVNASGQAYHGYLAAQELRALEEAGSTRLGPNEVTRTVGEDGVVDSVTAVVRATDPRLGDDKQAVGRAFAIQRGVPFEADGNVLGHRLFGPGGVAHLAPPGVIIDPEGYARLEQVWLAQLAAGNEVTIVASRLRTPGQAMDSLHLSITATPRSGPAGPTPPIAPQPPDPTPVPPAGLTTPTTPPTTPETPTTPDPQNPESPGVPKAPAGPGDSMGSVVPAGPSDPSAVIDEPANPAYRVERFVPGWVLVSHQSGALLEDFGAMLAENDAVDNDPRQLAVDLASVRHEGNGVYRIRTETGETFRLVKRVGPLQPGIQLEYSVELDGVPTVDLQLSDRLAQHEVAPLLARVLAESAAIVRGDTDGPAVFRPDSTPQIDAVQQVADLGDRAELRQYGVDEQLRRTLVQAEIHKLALSMGVADGQPNAELLRTLLGQDERAVLDRVADRGEVLDDDRVSRGGYVAKAALSSGWSSIVIGVAATVFTGDPLVGLGIAVPTLVNALVGSLSERYLDAQKQPGKKPAYTEERVQREFDYPGLHGLLDGPEQSRPPLTRMPRATRWSNYLVRHTTPTLATAAVAGALTLFGVPALSTALVIASSALAKSLAERLVDVKKLDFRLRRVDATERIRLSDPALYSNQLVTELGELQTRLDRVLAALDIRSGIEPRTDPAASPPAGVTPVRPPVPGAPPFRITLAVQLIDNVAAAARRVFVGGQQAVDVDPTELARHVSAQVEGLLNAVGPGLFGSVAGAMGDKYFINREEAANDARKQWARREQEAAQAEALSEILRPRLAELRQLTGHLEGLVGAPPDLAARAADRSLPAPTAPPGEPRPSGQSTFTAYAVQVAAAALGGAASAIGLDLVFDLPDLGVVLTVAGAAGAMIGTPVARYLFRRTEIDIQAQLEKVLAKQAVDRTGLLEQRAVSRYLVEQLAARAEEISGRERPVLVTDPVDEAAPHFTDLIRAALRRAELDNVPPGHLESLFDHDARAERIAVLQRIDSLAAEVDRLQALGRSGGPLTDVRSNLSHAITLYEQVADSNGVRREFPELGTVDPQAGQRVVGGPTAQARAAVEQAIRRLVAEPAGKPLLAERLVALEKLAFAADAVDHHALHGTDASRALVRAQFDEALEEANRLWQEAGSPQGLVLPALNVSPRESTGRHHADEPTGRHHAEEPTGRHHAEEPTGRHHAKEPTTEYVGRHRPEEVAPAAPDRSELDVRSDLPGGRHRVPEEATEQPTNEPVPDRAPPLPPGAIPLEGGGHYEATQSTSAPSSDNPLDVAAVRRAAERIARRAARLAPPQAAPEAAEQAAPEQAAPDQPGDGPTGPGQTVHAPEVPGTRFVADGTNQADTGQASTGQADTGQPSTSTASHPLVEVVRKALEATEDDFGGLIIGQPGQAAEGVVVVQTGNEPQYFKVTRAPVPAGRVAATTVRAGTVGKPHLVRIPTTLAADQLTRAWVHEISHTLQEQAAPRSRLRRLLRRPSAHTVDLCVAAQFNEFRLLSRQLAEARTDAEATALRHDIEGLVEAIRPRHTPPQLPWIAGPVQHTSPTDSFVADVTDQVNDLQRQVDELDHRIAAKTEAADRAAESAQQAEQTVAEALQTADSGRFARAHQAGKEAAKHAEVRAWHQRVAAAYQEARHQLETVAEGYRSLLADAASTSPEQRAKLAADLVNELTAYEQSLAAVAPPLIALSSLLPTDWLPHLSALTNQVNAVLAANRVDHRFTAGSLQHRLNAEFGQAVTNDGAILQVGHARPIELRFRLSVSDLIEVLDPSVRASETMLGLLPQPSRKFGITQNGKVGASGAFGLSMLTQLFGEHSWVNALGQLVTVKGEQSSGWGRSVTSNGAQYGQDGTVEDNRGESLLYAGQASWQVQARRPGEPDRLLADVTVDRGQGKDVSRLRAWASHAYTVLAPTKVFTNGTAPSGRLPNHTLTSLDGLQSLTDQVFSEYGDQLSRFGDQASLLREQIQSAITQDLPSRLAESTEQSLLRPLQADGRPVGHLEVRTEVRYEQVELVGDTSTAHWQERVRVGFSNASGQQNFSASTTLNATVGYGGQALTDLGDTSVDLGPSATAGRSLNRSESLSGGGVGIHVGVQRYTGPTQGYRMVFEHKVTLVLDGESQGTVTGDTEGLARLHTNDAYRHGLPVAESAFVHDQNGHRVVENGVPVLRGDPRTGVDVLGRRLELPNWLAGGTSRLTGAGPGLAQRVTGGEQALADLAGPLTERGYLPPLDDQGNPDLARMTTDPLLRQGQLLNLTELRTQLSVNRLEAGYDIAVQSGILVTLTKPVTGAAAETLTLRIDLRTGPPSAVGVTNDEAMVTLNIGSDTASRTDGWGKSLPWRASPLGLTQDAPGGTTASSGVSYGRQALGRVMGWFTGGTLNQVTLVESRSPVAAFEVPHRIEVTELGAEPVVLHSGTPGTSARILVDTDLLPSTEVVPTPVSSGPVSDQVLDRATLVALDTHELNRLAQELGGQDPTARHHLAAFLDPRHLLAHPEWARTTYRTDALVRGAGPVSTRGSLAVHGRIGDVVLLGTSDAVVGDINLALTSHGLSAGRSTGGSTSATVGATGDGRGGKLSGEYGTNSSASRTDQTIAGVERLTIEVGRHYLFAGTAGLAVTADGKPAAADATVVFQVAERDVLRFHLDGELTLPLAQVADAVERYLNGSLELDRRLATGLVRQYRAALATAEAEGVQVPKLSAAHTARALLEKLQPQRGKPTPRSKAAQLDLVLDQAERIDATRTVEIPEHYKENLGSSLVEQASVTDQGDQVALFDKVRALVSEQLGIAPDSDPMLAEALAVDLAGKRWWGRLEDMLGPEGFARTYPVGQPGQLGAQQVSLRIRAEFTDEAVSLGTTQTTISIVQRYLYGERTAAATSGRSLGAGVDGSWQEGRTGSAGTDRTGSTAVSVGEQTTRVERIATFDGQHRVRRGLKFTVEIAPGATATPARNRVGRALSRTESPLTPPAPVTLDGEVVQLIPLRVLPETDGPAPQRRTDDQPIGSLNERGVPDAYFVEDAKSNELAELVLRKLAELLGQAGMRVHRPELAVMLSTATLNASFSRMAQQDGFAVLRLPLPGYASQSVEVRVGATVVGAQLIGGPVDDVEIGEVNRSQHTVTHTVTSGRLLPVDGGTNLEDAGSGATGGVTAGDQLADQTSDGRGVRRERSRFEKGRVVTARVEVEYDVRLVKQELRRSGEVRAGRETEVEQTPRGVAYLTMFESDYQQLEQFLADRGPVATASAEEASTVSYADFEARLRGQTTPLYRMTNLVTDLEDDDDEEEERRQADRLRSSVVRATSRNPH